jgi:hypothetical protein
MTTYYKATNGVLTVFRATERRTYASAWIRQHVGRDLPVAIGFSAKPDGCPVVEIDQDEYRRLAAIRDQRLFGDRTKHRNPRACDAWVHNSELIDN